MKPNPLPPSGAKQRGAKQRGAKQRGGITWYSGAQVTGNVLSGCQIVIPAGFWRESRPVAMTG